MSRHQQPRSFQKENKTMKRFFSRLFGSRSRTPRPKPARRARVGIEALEDRQLMSAGHLDPMFGNFYGRTTVAFDRHGGAYDRASAVAIQPDGKSVIAGTAEWGTSGDTDFAITRLNPDGSRDWDFGTNGQVTVGFDLGGFQRDSASAVAIDAYGRIVVAGTVEVGGGNYDFGTTRLTPEGTRDYSFGINGLSVAGFNLGGAGNDQATSMVLDGYGRILVAGTAQYNSSGDYDFAVARLSEDGWFDPSFSDDGRVTVSFDLGGNRYDAANAIALDHQGRIVVAGSAARNGPDGSDFAIARLLDDGSLDWSFGRGGRQNVTFDRLMGGAPTTDWGHALTVDPSGRIVVAGAAYNGNGAFAVTRLLDNGWLDPSFGRWGRQIVQLDLGDTLFDSANAVAIDHQGRIVLAGTSLTDTWTDTEVRRSSDASMARLLDDGSLDTSFGRAPGYSWFDMFVTDGGEDHANAIAIDANGDIVMVGSSQYRWGTSDYDFFAALVESE
jgi:uncharacterized delta-60 repeat protein